jgi:hypothetical protein
LTVVPVAGLGSARVIETTFGAIEYACPPVKGMFATATPPLSATPVPFAISSPSVPVAVPVVALTVQVVPVPVTVVTLVPVAPGRAVRLKFAAFTPVTLLLKVTDHATVVALVGFAPARLIVSTFVAIV